MRHVEEDVLRSLALPELRYTFNDLATGVGSTTETSHLITMRVPFRTRYKEFEKRSDNGLARVEFLALLGQKRVERARVLSEAAHCGHENRKGSTLGESPQNNLRSGGQQPHQVFLTVKQMMTARRKSE